MNQLEFAQSLIRAPLVKRLTDRTFIGTIGTALGAVAAAIAVWQTEGVPVGDKINATIAAFAAVAGVVAAFTVAEKAKDTGVAKAAISAQAISTINEPAPVAQTVTSGSPVPRSVQEYAAARDARIDAQLAEVVPPAWAHAEGAYDESPNIEEVSDADDQAQAGGLR